MKFFLKIMFLIFIINLLEVKIDKELIIEFSELYKNHLKNNRTKEIELDQKIDIDNSKGIDYNKKEEVYTHNPMNMNLVFFLKRIKLLPKWKLDLKFKSNILFIDFENLDIEAEISGNLLGDLKSKINLNSKMNLNYSFKQNKNYNFEVPILNNNKKDLNLNILKLYTENNFLVTNLSLKIKEEIKKLN